MDGSVALIEKYKARLNPKNEFKKIFRALQKLNEIEMTFELLQETGIGKAVNSLRKTKGLGDLAREIVSKWKRLVNPPSQSKIMHKEYSPSVKSEPVEYDPTQNWEMTKQSPYKPSVKLERIEDDEYDPSQNWQMQNGSDSSAHAPSTSKVKKEKSSPVKQKKRKRHDDERKDSPKISKKDASREAELLATLQRTQEELKRIKKQKKKPDVKVKIEKESPERSQGFESPQQNGDIEEYDPQNNYGVSNSPSTYDPGSPGSSQSYEPSTQEEEYDPGGDEASASYQPSSTFEPGSSRVTDQQNEDGDSEASYEEDEPGAYLLHPRRASNSRRSSETSQDVQNTSDSFVLSTTLYERNKSVDSEDGSWGSKVNGIKIEPQDVSPIYEEPSETSMSNSKKSSKRDNRAEMRPEKSAKRTDPSKKHKSSSEKSDKTLKVKKERDSSGKSRESSSKKANSEKRKQNHELSPKPEKKKVKGEKSEVKDAGFLFQGITEVQNAKKKKKKSKTHRDNFTPTPITLKPKPKLNLHLPEIQTSYRPLPHSSGGVSEKRRSAGEVALTDNEAAELHSKRQTKKMLVYSGGGGGFLPKMMSLFDQCMLVLANNIDAIDVFGGIPFEIVQPILKKCTPEQLYRLEDSNPYLLEDTDALWEQHALREFRGKTPEELESWREMYLRLSDEREAKLQSLTQIIQAKEAKKKPLEKKVMLAYVGANAKPPRSVRRAQEKYGTASKRASSSVPSSSRSVASAVRREIVDSRMSIPEGSITAASVDRESRLRMVKEVKKPRVAPMMAKTLKSIGKLRFKR